MIGGGERARLTKGRTNRSDSHRNRSLAGELCCHHSNGGHVGKAFPYANAESLSEKDLDVCSRYASDHHSKDGQEAASENK